jgi:hypothetical protein
MAKAELRTIEQRLEEFFNAKISQKDTEILALRRELDKLKFMSETRTDLSRIELVAALVLIGVLASAETSILAPPNPTGRAGVAIEHAIELLAQIRERGL